MTDNTTSKRPLSITIICIIGFLGAAVALPLIFSPIASAVGPWYPPYLAFSSLVGLICMVGLWKMERWAAYTYTIFVVINQIVMLVMGVWNVFALLIPAIVIFFALRHLPKMS